MSSSWTFNRGGIQYTRPNPRQGEPVYVYDVLPGARVYVLEDVFTVERVEGARCIVEFQEPRTALQ